MIRRLVNTDPPRVSINVTPIIDVALVLVIILMITAPMIAVPPLGLELPEARSKSLGNDPHVNITLGSDGRIAIDEDLVARPAFRSSLTQRLAGREPAHRFLVIRADEGAAYENVRDLLEDARAAGATRIAIATRPPEIRR